MTHVGPSRRARMRAAIRATAGPARLLLAAKTAVAAAIAWYLAPLIPFAADEYSYYAPLGVVVSMYPTLAGSARSGLQTLVGLAAGIGLGLLALQVGALGVLPGIVLAVTVGLGVLAGGIRRLGPGSEWITMAALFVLLIGGSSDPETFSLSYIVTMAFGVVVGVLVNLVVLPPLYLGKAGERLSSLRDALAGRLDEMAEAVSRGAVDDAALGDAMDALTGDLGDVADEVREAELSRRGNPRARRTASEQELNATRLRALERTIFFTRDLADVLGRLPSDDPTLRGEASERLADAIRACRELVATSPGAEEAAGRVEKADAAVESYLSALDPSAHAMTSLAEKATAAVCLRRMVDASRPFA